VGVALLAAATIVFEISLTRIFSQAQFYHFAFMAVSLALLGFGASGSVLSVCPRLMQGTWRQRLPWLALSCGLGMPASYLLGNALPLDVYAVAWDVRQVAYLIAYFLVLSVPFVLSGLTVAVLLASLEGRSDRVYGASLLGSAVGCLAAICLLGRLGGPGTIVAASLLAGLGGLVLAHRTASTEGERTAGGRGGRVASLCGYIALLAFVLLRAGSLDVKLSPYKGLSQALRFPGSSILRTARNSYGRVDLVESDGIRQLPGLSYTYKGDVPRQLGISMDGDELWPVPLIADLESDAEFTAYMPASLAYRLRPDSDVLLLQPRGGLDLWVALSQGAATISAVEDNPLVIESAQVGVGAPFLDPFADPRTTVITETLRSHLARSTERYDIVHLSLAQSYRPVTSAVYSLSDDYVHTTQAFSVLVEHLRSDGILLITRWLQTPPSESVRTMGLLLSALESAGVSDPERHVVAYRGVQTITFLTKRKVFSNLEMQQVRFFCTERRYDLVIGPGVSSSEVNQYNVLPDDLYAQALGELISAEDRSEFYGGVDFDVAPPTDDRPFFAHYFKWRQAPVVARELGKTWQPFGGSGVLIIVALLVMVIAASAVFIVTPLLVSRAWSTDRERIAAARVRSDSHAAGGCPSLGRHTVRRAGFAYFSLIGLGFMLVEIPLIQRLIVLLDRPIYAMATVLFALLLFSGIGSIMSSRIALLPAMALLVACIALGPVLLPHLINSILGLDFTYRLVIVVALLAPIGLLMGLPMARGIVWLRREDADTIPWAWAINGCASVIGSVAAAIMALSWGYVAVMELGAVCYAAAGLIAFSKLTPGRAMTRCYRRTELAS